MSHGNRGVDDHLLSPVRLVGGVAGGVEVTVPGQTLLAAATAGCPRNTACAGTGVGGLIGN